MQLSVQDDLKALAAARALEWVKPGTIVGLGTGSTARYFIEGLGKLVRQGLAVRTVATSSSSADLARSLGMVVLDDFEGEIDLAVDGADEIDPARRLVKGRGGAMVREKLVATIARRFVVVADASKRVPALGQGPVPVEVLPFLWRGTRERLVGLGATCQVRGGEQNPFRTDNDNMVLDLVFSKPFDDPAAIAARLKQIVGVVDHGIFPDPADVCIIAGATGVEILGGGVSAHQPVQHRSD